jgi:hypothetical protein
VPDEPDQDFQPQRPKAVPNFAPPSNDQPRFGPYNPGDFPPGMRPVEMDQFASDVAELIDSYRQSKDDKNRAQARSRLLSILTKKFESQHQRREKEIAALKARLKELTELHEKRGGDRKGIIERHADYLLRNVDGLGWENDFPEEGLMSTDPQSLPTY